MLRFLISLTGWGSSLIAFTLQSPAFEDQGEIPCEYTCCGRSSSLRLIWSDPPKETLSFALKITDRSNGADRWIAYDIPLSARELIADFKGMCPPVGEKHFYVFDLYALNSAAINFSTWDEQTIDHAQLSGSLLIPIHPTAPNPPIRNQKINSLYPLKE